MVRTLLYGHMLLLSRHDGGIIILASPGDGYVRRGSTLKGPSLYCHGRPVFRSVRVAAFCRTASVGVDLRPRAYLFRSDEHFLLTSMYTITKFLD